MFAIFCVRLAFGLLAALLLLWSSPVNPRFFRAHFLIALGLLIGAAALLHDTYASPAWWLLLGSAVVCALGSMSWMLELHPGGRVLIAAAALTTAAALALVSVQRGGAVGNLLADDFTSALYLGAAVTAMLLGHSYLIAPNLSIRPLQLLLAALAATLVVRLGVALYGLSLWTASPSHDNLETEVYLWLAVRWGVGFLLPLLLGWMAWETARIRSTQSATGILYVVVICCFLGELTSQLLQEKSGMLL
jgi:hypothetical protein